jgi:hypothetical protein
VTKIAFYHLKNISKVRPFLSYADTENLIHAFITSMLDYCNALPCGIPKKAIGQLQHTECTQNASAQVLTKTRRRAQTTPVLKSLHWFPVSFRINVKIVS